MPAISPVMPFILLFAVWCLLSGHWSGLLLTLGAASGALAAGVYLRLREGAAAVVSLGLAAYSVWLLGAVARSSVAVLLAVADRSRLAPAFFTVGTGDLNEVGRVIYANSITLTPGTVSVRVERDAIQVHGLLRGAEEELAGGDMLRRVAALRGATDGAAGGGRSMTGGGR